jgi:hypothetical protein
MDPEPLLPLFSRVITDDMMEKSRKPFSKEVGETSIKIGPPNSQDPRSEWVLVAFLLSGTGKSEIPQDDGTVPCQKE